MYKGVSQAHSNDSFQMYNLNQAGLQQAEQNYFMKYATSGFSEVNNTQRITKRVDTKILPAQTGAFSKIKNTQNEVLRELKQQYEILRNLPIQDKIDPKSKIKVRPPTSEYSSSIDQRSEISSSKHSHTKKRSRDAQILAIEKKQLEIVISNSLKKIEELLQNQMELKKTIHELKLQIQGKGGINSEYEMQIRSFRKNQKQMHETIETLKIQIERKNAALKELGEKNAFLEGEKSRRDQEHKSFYDSQRQLQDLLRKQKDKSMNAELQVKRIQMELQIYQKDKTAQITRLTRQLEIKNQAPDREAQTIRRLQEQIRMKDHKIETFVQQIQSLRGQIARPVSPPPQAAQDQNRKILEELVKQMKSRSETDSKDNNEMFVRAIVDKLGNRKDQTLKNQLSSLRVQLQSIRRNSTVSDFGQEGDLKNKIRELERIIDEQKRQKRDLQQQIDRLKNERDDVQQQLRSHRQQLRRCQDRERQLISEIEQLQNFRVQLTSSKMENQEIRRKLQTIISGHHPEGVRVEFNGHHSLEQSEEEIRGLRRTVDELRFALNKVTQEKTMSENMLKESQGKQILRLNEDIFRYRQLLKKNEEQLSRVNQQYKTQVEQKNHTIESLTKRFEDLDKRNRETLEGSRSNYESLLKAQVEKHYNELQTMNLKVIQLTKTNQTFLSQGQYFANLEREVNQLRRLTRTQKRTNEAIDHLWQIKEAQYGNISQILASVRG